jgi:hypothetical protein
MPGPVIGIIGVIVNRAVLGFLGPKMDFEAFHPAHSNALDSTVQ